MKPLKIKRRPEVVTASFLKTFCKIRDSNWNKKQILFNENSSF
jgi:hypothetical protein